jgi:hypothetical protein
MQLPEGGPLPFRFERDNHPEGPVFKSPEVFWLSTVGTISDRRTEAIEGVMKEIATAIGCTHVWIRKENHCQRYVYNAKGERIPRYNVFGRQTGWVIADADCHMTVSMGVNDWTVSVQGHVYVTEDAAQIPTGLMQAGTRVHVVDGDDRILELYERSKRDGSKLPPRPAGSAQHCPGHPTYGMDDHWCEFPRFLTRALNDHYCPCPHTDVHPDDDHYCPCAHDEVRRADHYCPCPHHDASRMVDHWCPCPHDEMRFF